jgi:hypothetical protein
MNFIFRKKKQKRYKMNKLWIILIVFVIVLSGCTVQRGTVKDRVFSIDTGIIWNHVYFVNDHTTTYCLDKNSVNEYEFLKTYNGTVTVEYEKNIFGRGFLCSGQGDTEVVVITKIIVE